LGRNLVTAAIASARRIGYTELLLDTLATMHAIALYESFGFERTDPYYANPLLDVLYFRASLKSGRKATMTQIIEIVSGGQTGADRLLVNLVIRAQADAAPLSPLPAGYEAGMDKLGIVDHR